MFVSGHVVCCGVGLLASSFVGQLTFLVVYRLVGWFGCYTECYEPFNQTTKHPRHGFRMSLLILDFYCCILFGCVFCIVWIHF